MNHLFLVNPAAGKRDATAACRAAVADAFAGRRESWALRVSEGPGHCEAMAREACQSGDEVRLYACGGDGTLNEVVNGAVGCPNAAVTHFPTGSGNDFIKTASDPAAFRRLPLLLDGDEGRFDLIRVNGGRCALNICSMGFDARIGTEIARYKRLPLVTGRGAYVISAVVNTVRGIAQPYEITLDGGETLSGKRTLVCIANGRWYGGSFNPIPEARPDDGILDVLVVEPVSRLTVARVIGKYRRGLYRQYPELITARRCRSLRIRCDRPSAVNVDGELLRETDVTFRIADEKIRFVYPKGLTWSGTSEEIGRIPAEKRENIR